MNCKTNRNGSNGEISKTSTRKLPKWVTKKPMISNVQNLTTATMNRKKIITNGVLLAITVMVHGDITGRLTTESGKISKSRTNYFNFQVLPPMH